MNELKNLSKEIQKKVELALNQKEGALFECNNSLCNNYWRSTKIITTCPKCKQNLVSLIYDEKSEPRKGINFFRQEEY